MILDIITDLNNMQNIYLPAMSKQYKAEDIIISIIFCLLIFGFIKIRNKYIEKRS